MTEPVFKVAEIRFWVKTEIWDFILCRKMNFWLNFKQQQQKKTESKNVFVC